MCRYCLWVLGNASTLVSSGSVWNKLVVDAKSRGCFYNANEDKNFAQALVTASINLAHTDKLLCTDSLLFREAKWKVCNRYFERVIASLSSSSNSFMLRYYLFIIHS